MDTTRASLLLRIRNRADESAWKEFDSVYRPMLLRFARASGLPDADAEDVVQHCMTAISKKIDAFEYDRARGRFKGWLRTLVNNRVRNLFRDRRDQNAASQAFNRSQKREALPEAEFDRIWMEEHIKHCLRQIREEVNESTFAAFEQYVINNRPVEQVAADLEMSANQVYKAKWRITGKLRERLDDLLGPDEKDRPDP